MPHGFHETSVLCLGAVLPCQCTASLSDGQTPTPAAHVHGLSAVLVVCKRVRGSSHERSNICAGWKRDGPQLLTASKTGLRGALEAEPTARSCTLAHEQQCPARKGVPQTKPFP